jgi:hypothetical protein
MLDRTKSKKRVTLVGRFTLGFVVVAVVFVVVAAVIVWVKVGVFLGKQVGVY